MPVVVSDSYLRLCETSQASVYDLCSNFEHLCQNGRCVNTPGSYRCDCDKGYRLTRDGMCVGTYSFTPPPLV